MFELHWYPLCTTVQKTVVVPAVSLFFDDKFQQSWVRVEGASASIHLLHAGHPCCATVMRPQCKLCSRLQRSHWCVCSSWSGLTCPLLRNDWRRGAGSACSSGVPQLRALAVGTAFGWGRQAAVVCFSWVVGTHHTGVMSSC